MEGHMLRSDLEFNIAFYATNSLQALHIITLEFVYKWKAVGGVSAIACKWDIYLFSSFMDFDVENWLLLCPNA